MNQKVRAASTDGCPEVDPELVIGATWEHTVSIFPYRLEGAFLCGPVSHPELEA
jgi:hypothetical protein